MKIEGTGKERKIEISKEYVEKSYHDGHRVEAIILTHYILEVCMNRTFIMAVKVLNPFGSGMMERVMLKSMKRDKSLYPISSYKFLTIADILLDLGIYKAELCKKLEKFNKYRNIAAHRLFENLPTKDELDTYFQLGINLWDETWKIEERLNKSFFDSIEKSMENK